MPHRGRAVVGRSSSGDRPASKEPSRLAGCIQQGEVPLVGRSEAEIAVDIGQRIRAVGHAFSIEPGIYIEGKWGMRLEDIVVIEADGAHRCNNSDRSLREVAA